jgi:hypothetical protein
MITRPHSMSLIQRCGDAELPATGHWTLHRASFVAISIRRHQLQLAVCDGSLTVADPPDRSTLAITAAQGDREIALTASTVGLEADRHGFSRWQLTGIVEDGSTRHTIRLDMAYHGVRRVGDQAWAWFSGRATTPRETRRPWSRRAGVVVVVDLLFSAPTAAAAASTRPTVPGELVDATPGIVPPGDLVSR